MVPTIQRATFMRRHPMKKAALSSIDNAARKRITISPSSVP